MNTGRKIYQWLIEIDEDTGLATGNRKPNVPSDPDYIPPFTDYVSCPIVRWEGINPYCELDVKILSMKTFSGYQTPSYPVGVFNINGDYLGIANNQAEYVSLWNSDIANNAQGLLQSGANSLQFYLPLSSTISEVTGCRFWYITGTGNTVVWVDNNDLVENSGVIIKANTQPIRTVLHAGSSIPFSAYDYDYPTNTPFRRVLVSTSNSLVRIFHNEDSYIAGYSQFYDGGSGIVKDLGGHFPEKVKKIIVKSNQRHSVNNTLYTNIVNWSDLLDVRVFNPHIFTPWIEGVDIPLFTQMNKLTRIGFFYQNNYDYFQLTEVNFPDLLAVTSGFNGNGNTYSLVGHSKITQGLDFRLNGFTVQRVDDLYNQLAIELNGIIPQSGIGAGFAIQYGNSTASAASLAARTYLQTQGWIIN